MARLRLTGAAPRGPPRTGEPARPWGTITRVNLLLIEIGNTSVKVAIFDAGQPRDRWSVAAREIPDGPGAAPVRRLIDQAVASSAEPLHGAVIGSVVPRLTPVFAGAVVEAAGLEPMIVTSAALSEVMSVAVERPAEVGVDRLLNALAVFERVGGASIAVDVGTAATFDVVAHDGTYLGGAIAPGPGSALEALHAGTALLPRVDLARPARAIGTDTRTAMQSGLVNGYIGLVSGLLTALRAELMERSPGRSRISVVATGGYAAEPWLRDLPAIDAFDPDLTLHGLRLAHGILFPRPVAVAQ